MFNFLVDTRWLTSLFSALLLNESKVPEGALLWELIYPKGKDGRPTYNPSGKYPFFFATVSEFRTLKKKKT